MSTSTGCCSRPAFDFPNHNEVAPAAEQFPCRVPRQKVYKKYQVNSTWDAPAAKASGEAPPSELVQLVIGDPAEFSLHSDPCHRQVDKCGFVPEDVAPLEEPQLRCNGPTREFSNDVQQINRRG